jgi:hypothetical protein
MDTNKVLVSLAHRLRGNALYLAMRLLEERNGIVPWEEFKRQLLDSCCTSDTQFDFRVQLSGLSMSNGENYDKFLNKFQAISARMVGISD